MVRVVLTAALAAVTCGLTAIPTHAAPHDSRVSGVDYVVDVRAAVAALPVAEEHRDGFSRAKFKHWVDSDRDGCSTRKEVLLAESTAPITIGARCTLTGGSWTSAYDGTTAPDSRQLDIDHVVPLAEAWDSGAAAWDRERRERYANDLDEPRSLIAVTASSNRSKADQDPQEWLPPQASYRCTYLDDWVLVKTRWALTADPAEKAALTRLATNCPDTPLTITPGR